VAYGVTWYRQEAERRATRDARRLVVDTLSRLPADLSRSGDRYGAGAGRDHCSAGRWRGRHRQDDGTILFADDPTRVGQDPEMRGKIHAVAAGVEAWSTAAFGCFNLRVGEDGGLAAAVGRSPRDRRGGRNRGTVGLAAFHRGGGLRRAHRHRHLLRRHGASARARARCRASGPSRAGSKARPTPAADLPAYMQPGFQEEVQARLRVEEELETVEKERDSLRGKVRHLESQLETLRSQPSEPEPEPDAHVVPLSRR
jgi:hypothetical protein